MKFMKPKFGKILILFILLPLISNAQGIRFGVFADPQLSWFYSDTKKFKPNGPILGVNGGFSFEKFFAERYALTSGASISTLGGNLKYNEAGYKIETRDSIYTISTGANVKINGQYINVPLGFKFKTNEIGYTTFYAQVGLIGHIRLKGFVWEEWHKVEREVLTNSQLKLAYLSYSFGGGMEYSLGGPSALLVGVSFTNGITQTFDAGYGKITSGVLALRLGVVF